MDRHFVTFYSPGTFMAETSVPSWDVEAAVSMARSMKERHGSTPYGFQFTTRSRGDDDLDSKVVCSSPMYYLGGRVETLADVEARNDPSERILLSNMRGNGYDRIVVNENSYRWPQGLTADDVVLDFTP